MHPQPSAGELANLYGSEYFKRGDKYDQTVGHEKCGIHRNDYAKVDLVARYANGGRLVDVGCATGGFIAAALASGFDASGVEYSESAAELARLRCNVPIENSDLPNAGLEAASFDVVTMWDVIEHLPDPAPTLVEASRILRTGGRLFVSTGDVSSVWARVSGSSWQLLTPPQHLFFHTPRSLSLVLAKAGFEVEELSYPGKYVNLGFVSFKARESYGAIAAPLALLLRGLGLQKRVVYVNLKDIMTCVAVKTCSPDAE